MADRQGYEGNIMAENNGAPSEADILRKNKPGGVSPDFMDRQPNALTRRSARECGRFAPILLPCRPRGGRSAPVLQPSGTRADGLPRSGGHPHRGADGLPRSRTRPTWAWTVCPASATVRPRGQVGRFELAFVQILGPTIHIRAAGGQKPGRTGRADCYLQQTENSEVPCSVVAVAVEYPATKICGTEKANAAGCVALVALPARFMSCHAPAQVKTT
jgi:hypothetical protein